MSPAVLFNRYRRKVALVLGILWVTTCLTWPFSGRIRGQVAACFDLLHGHPKLLGLGLPLEEPKFNRVLKERYGIEVRQLGCMTSGMLKAYIAGYNEVIVAAEKHKFGQDMFKKAAREAGPETPFLPRMAVSASNSAAFHGSDSKVSGIARK
ncbi:MAG TPA: hypothetical protein VH351_08250 [Bryobacteraceae bacterium]|jgi:hypothetical protein|nr:hypothetical protein [Bryobacteraceae bacterium]